MEDQEGFEFVLILIDHLDDGGAGADIFRGGVLADDSVLLAYRQPSVPFLEIHSLVLTSQVGSPAGQTAGFAEAPFMEQVEALIGFFGHRDKVFFVAFRKLFQMRQVRLQQDRLLQDGLNILNQLCQFVHECLAALWTRWF